MRPENARLERLRGGLPPVEVGARGLEAIARNPACLRLRTIVVAGLTPSVIAQRVFGQSADGMSPFAMAANQNFKRHLLRNAAASLLTAYRERGRLTQAEAKIVSVPDQGPGDSLFDRQRREHETLRLVELKRKGDPSAPNLMLNPRLPIEIVGVTHLVELDYLIAGDAEDFYRVGVIKSYADRGGKTDPADIRAACREAAVGTLALGQVLAATGDDSARAGDRIDIILRAPASSFPRLFPAQLIEAELSSLMRALATAPLDLEEVERMIPAGADLSQPETIDCLPNNFGPGCMEHCALTDRCQAQAQVQGLPITLGAQAAEQLAAAGSIPRALDLMKGRGRPADNQAEAALARHLRDALQTLERIANG